MQRTLYLLTYGILKRTSLSVHWKKKLIDPGDFLRESMTEKLNIYRAVLNSLKQTHKHRLTHNPHLNFLSPHHNHRHKITLNPTLKMRYFFKNLMTTTLTQKTLWMKKLLLLINLTLMALITLKTRILLVTTIRIVAGFLNLLGEEWRRLNLKNRLIWWITWVTWNWLRIKSSY